MTISLRKRISWLEKNHILSLRRQCELLGICRSSFYYKPAQESPINLKLMGIIDEIHTRWPFMGTRQMTAMLRQKGNIVNRKRIRRLMRKMGIEAIYPKPSAIWPPHP